MSWYIELLKDEIGYKEINHVIECSDFKVVEVEKESTNIDNLNSHELHIASQKKLAEIKLAFS